MDDITLKLRPCFDDAACGDVREVIRRLAAGGLRIRLDKCLAVAPRGHRFSAAERRRLHALAIPFVDATFTPEERGFTTLGVPVGEDAYIDRHMRKHLFDDKLWRLGWQLAGMARSDFPAAFRIFRGSFTQRFMYLARNVDPEVGAPWFGGFDGLCAWVLDRVLHLTGAAPAADMRAFLQQACNAGDAIRAANDGPLVLPTLGPQDIVGTYGTPGLPLRVARLPTRVGGLAMPQLHLVCRAAFVGQLMTTLRARVIEAHGDLVFHRAPAAGAIVADFNPEELPPLLQALRRELRHWAAVYQARAAAKQTAAAPPTSQTTQLDEEGDVVMYAIDGSGCSRDVGEGASGSAGGGSGPEQSQGPGPAVPAQQAPAPVLDDLGKIVPPHLLKWAATVDGGGPPAVHAALAAIVSAAASSPAKINCEKKLCDEGILPPLAWCRGEPRGNQGNTQTPKEEPPPVQSSLTSALVDAQLAGLEKDLRRSGDAGKLVQAQLRSQRGAGAMAWLGAPAGRVSSVGAVIMVLVAVMVDAYRLDGDVCPFGGANCRGRPTCVHAIGCHRQHLRGNNGTHTQQKRALQRVLLRCHAAWVSNEDASVFNVANKRIDTVVAPGALMLAEKEEFALKGVLLDTTIRTPTLPTYLHPASGKSSAEVSGFAARKAEKDKAAHYKDTFDRDRWVLVTFAQESFGRFGKEALDFVGVLASHSAACRGGDESVILRRASIVRRQIIMEMSLALARELSERVQAYVRGSIIAGRSVDPVSLLLRPQSA